MQGPRVEWPLRACQGSDPLGHATPIWGDWEASVAAQLKDVRLGEARLLLMEACTVHLDLAGLKPLRRAKVYAFMLPSLVSQMFKPYDARVFLALRAAGWTYMRTLLPTIPVGIGFDVHYLLKSVAARWSLGMTPERTNFSFQRCGTWPIDISKVEDRRLRRGRGSTAASRMGNMDILVSRLKPEAAQRVPKAIASKREAGMAKVSGREQPKYARDERGRAEERKELISRDGQVQGPIITVQNERQLVRSHRKRFLG
ncbi:hypothetical protein BU14_0262s0009 [Porphyra umbilicalis]|uniref:Uncharacterized protein n=1 Tax=Porphyra umbilicalis TaxID=2786 RepID=A0A1X6P1Z1_PORUM|nr:hypothetical protein BU14_0262s0009 [Porphyra umbilicalis]|eukprot:OSX74892.1 hypothetical protein BU14_0262s0009 [Porphyra umbilicalis]